jgi:secretion/DNA translocation related TadE-like protein
MSDGTARRRGEDRGSAAVLVAGVCAVMMLLGTAAAWVSMAAYASVRAQSAADLSALAGATARLHLLAGLAQVDPCSAAAAVAALNGAALDSCAVDGVTNVTVSVSVRAPGVPAVAGSAATASARAGPAPSPRASGTDR